MANWYSDVGGESGDFEFRGHEDRGTGENSADKRFRDKFHCEKG